MIFSEDDLLSISLLQHLVFCPRRAYLVHNEQMWAENAATATGSIYHDSLDDRGPELRGDIRIVRGLRLRSMKLGLIGIADIVEFHRAEPEQGAVLPNAKGFWRPYPVEHKIGRMREEKGYKVQLCAQALCLEEMLNTNIPDGAIFYGKPRRRLDVEFSTELRELTIDSAMRLHHLSHQHKAPAAEYNKKCSRCSMMEACMPGTAGSGKSVNKWLSRVLNIDDNEMEG